MTFDEAMGIFDRHGLTGRVPHLDVLVAEALKRVEAERDAVNEELVKALDLAILYERDRDQCARERDAYKAERDALLRAAPALLRLAEAVQAYYKLPDWTRGQEMRAALADLTTTTGEAPQ